jgi:hypothetical protein
MAASTRKRTMKNIAVGRVQYIQSRVSFIVIPLYPVRKPYHKWQNNTNMPLIPFRKGGVKTPSLSNGVYTRPRAKPLAI